MEKKLKHLASLLEGTLHVDQLTRTMYATDASAYAEMPLAVAVPKSVADLKMLIAFASDEKTSLIPRTAGTSLAGQVVGGGIVVDFSYHFNKISELNVDEKWVRVQPGVVRDELNAFLKPFGLFFAPETSTANRAMIGGMVGNNSCGSNSVVYRSTREHTLAITALLSDGTEVEFRKLSLEEFNAKCSGTTLEASLYRSIKNQLGDLANQQEIRKEFPKKSIDRRNTGYALDLLLDSKPFNIISDDFNFCSLLCGAEGTLAIATDIKLSLCPLPPKHKGLLCVHFKSIEEALKANLVALKYKPYAVELIDHYILECTQMNISQKENRFFVKGNPNALLVIELCNDDKNELLELAAQLEIELREEGLGYHFPLVFDEDIKKVWTLRKAGLGLLSNLPGDDKAVPVIEDTAVDVVDLPAYIREFNQILGQYGLHSVHYAHAGSGELHLRPILNLKTAEGHQLFRRIAEEIAVLVKKYDGSLSGEHGDGRLRGEFIPKMVGERNYQLFKDLKNTWDPLHIFNPGKIVDTPPMDTMLRYVPEQKAPEVFSVFRYPGQTILQHIEQCNGSGDCRKSHLAGGTMCPSYMATRAEKDTTRARANVLRTFLSRNEKNPFDHPEIKEVMDLCLSCKGCKSECPSNVDMAKLKAEFLQAYQDKHGIPLRSRLIANFASLSKLTALMPRLYNYTMQSKLMGAAIKRVIGFDVRRSMPLLPRHSLKAWHKTYKAQKRYIDRPVLLKTVYFFCDEFTNYQDAEIGIKAIILLEYLGYQVIIPDHAESGRACISKGLLRKAKRFAEENVERLGNLVSAETPLLGIEPSAILSFRDEYPDLVGDFYVDTCRKLASHTFLIEEFLAKEIRDGQIAVHQFQSRKQKIKLHGHCQQKALGLLKASEFVLSFPQGQQVEIIQSGCCGMAGSFGYEKEHYQLSMEIGNLVLFPQVRAAEEDVIIAAPGTSCRHQVKDGTGKRALHPIEILFDLMKPNDK